MTDVAFTHLDQELFDGASATKRDLIDYLDAIADRFVDVLRDRPLSVIRVRPGQEPFMQKNLPKYAPDWIATTTRWAEASRRDVSYPLANDRRTLLWFGNQRAVEFHPGLARIDDPGAPTHLVIDLDPPDGGDFGLVVRVAHLVRAVLRDAGLAGAVKTSGAKGLHVFVPLPAPTPQAPTPQAPASETPASEAPTPQAPTSETPTPRATTTQEDIAAATRALAARVERLDPSIATTAFIRDDRAGKVFVDATRAGGATVAAAYSPRIRPGVPVSFPVAWSDLDDVTPGDFTVHNAARLIAGADPWARDMPPAVPLDSALIAEGHEIPIARVQAMHEGKRRARARRDA
jgi:bifunctional non-homologous end joining protein LigD